MELLSPSAGCIPVFCPTMPSFGRLWLPLAGMQPTAAINRLLVGALPPPSLCRLFQTGGCLAGARCNQLHLDPDLWRDAVARLSALCTCCAAHGDALSAARPRVAEALQRIEVVVVRADGTRSAAPAGHVAYTAYWRMEKLKCEAGGRIEVPADRLCRLNAKGTCRQGPECRNVHLCREVLRAMAAGADASPNWRDAPRALPPTEDPVPRLALIEEPGLCFGEDWDWATDETDEQLCAKLSTYLSLVNDERS